MNGYGSTIRVILEADGSATVWDDGRGILWSGKLMPA
jgi:DNA gyrase/topoisomerase IV subunit B